MKTKFRFSFTRARNIGLDKRNRWDGNFSMHLNYYGSCPLPAVIEFNSLSFVQLQIVAEVISGPYFIRSRSRPETSSRYSAALFYWGTFYGPNDRIMSLAPGRFSSHRPREDNPVGWKKARSNLKLCSYSSWGTIWRKKKINFILFHFQLFPLQLAHLFSVLIASFALNVL